MGRGPASPAARPRPQEVVAGVAMRFDLEAGYFYSEEHGFGRITEMLDVDGDETVDPDLCAACVVYLAPGRYLSVPVREWWLTECGREC